MCVIGMASRYMMKKTATCSEINFQLILKRKKKDCPSIIVLLIISSNAALDMINKNTRIVRIFFKKQNLLSHIEWERVF